MKPAPGKKVSQSSFTTTHSHAPFPALTSIEIEEALEALSEEVDCTLPQIHEMILII